MNRSTLAKRYLPLALVVAVQALIIAIVPSTAPSSSLAAGAATAPVSGYSTGAGAPGSPGASVPGTPGVDAATGVPAAGGGPYQSGSSSGTPSAGVASGGASTVGAAGTGSADTSHCVSGREFSPALDYYAPPCTPGTPGAPPPANNPASWQGVTKSSITIVDYVSNYGAEVNTILQAEGQLETYQQAQPIDAAFQNFINSHYVLWGRKLHIVTYQGKCQSVPPNYSCLLAEMDSIVSQYHPYAVYWGTTLCSACFARLAQDHTVAFGGAGFSDQFLSANAPYVWEAGVSSSTMETDFARWWCSQLSSTQNSGRKVSFALSQNPAQNFNGQPRVLGVISTNDPDNENTVSHVLFPALQADCGQTVTHTYYYSQDINTAAQQVEAGISAMDTPTNPATDVLCLCDPVAPAFLYEGEATHNYWPENVLADVQGMTNDVTSQSYESGLGCPDKNPCEYDDAFGLSDVYPQPSQSDMPGVKIFAAGGGKSLNGVTGLTANTVWTNYNMLASLIENTGPDLTPARMAAAAPSMGMRGGGTTGYAQLGFLQGVYSWGRDVEVAYWDKTKTSSYNGAPGTFVPIEGSRFSGSFPTMSEPPIPSNRP